MNKNHRALSTLLGFVTVFFAAQAPASAVIAVSISNATVMGAPVELTELVAVQNDDRSDLAVCVGFRNIGAQPATAIRFHITLYNAFHEKIYENSEIREGLFSPGVTIAIPKTIFGEPNGNAECWSGFAEPNEVSNVTVAVETVRYDDGNTWSASLALSGPKASQTSTAALSQDPMEDFRFTGPPGWRWVQNRKIKPTDTQLIGIWLEVGQSPFPQRIMIGRMVTSLPLDKAASKAEEYATVHQPDYTQTSYAKVTICGGADAILVGRIGYAENNRIAETAVLTSFGGYLYMADYLHLTSVPTPPEVEKSLRTLCSPTAPSEGGTQ